MRVGCQLQANGHVLLPRADPNGETPPAFERCQWGGELLRESSSVAKPCIVQVMGLASGCG